VVAAPFWRHKVGVPLMVNQSLLDVKRLKVANPVVH
jgi:hypothetical protein